MRVEHRVGRQAVLVPLVRAQLRRRRLRDHPLRDHRPRRPLHPRPVVRVPPAAGLEHPGLVDVLDRVVAAGHVAVDRRRSPPRSPTCCRWSAASRRTCWTSAISSTPRSRDCRFSSVTSSASPANSGASVAVSAARPGSIDSSSSRQPSAAATAAASSRLSARGELRGQHHAAHVLRPRARPPRSPPPARCRPRRTARAAPCENPDFAEVVAERQHHRPVVLLADLRMRAPLARPRAPPVRRSPSKSDMRDRLLEHRQLHRQRARPGSARTSRRRRPGRPGRRPC